jgi:PAS domain S-box-containing protein
LAYIDTTPAQPVSGPDLARVLRARKDDLLRHWILRVVTDPGISVAAEPHEPKLLDRIPELFDRIVGDLDAADSGEVSGRAIGARITGRERGQAPSGHELTAELRELSHFRVAILDLCAMEGVVLVGDVAGLVHAAIDESMSTRAVQIEQATLEAQRRRADLFDQSHDAVVVWRPAGGGIVSWNRGAEELYGWSASEAIGRVTHELFQTEDPAGLGMEEYEAFLAREGRWEGELHHTTRHGRALVVDARVVVVQRDALGMLLMETNRDITERKRAEDERAQALESERAARSAAERAAHLRDEFVATVSHELRTPLNAMLGWTALLRSGKLDAEKTAKALEVVERNTRVQVELVEDLLDLSRIGSGKLRLDVRPVDLAALVETAVASHVPAAEKKGVRLHVATDGRAYAIAGDPGRLEQVVSNLLSNAIKFTPPGGFVGIDVHGAGSRAELVVRDTGSGIPASFLPHAFDRFRQAESSLTRQQRGLGLGLALVKHLVEGHGGEVRAESEGEGRGATFTVSLPIETAPRVDGASPSPMAARASLEGVKALVVDDEEDARALTSRILEDCDVEVASAGSASEALDRLPRFRPDVLISDIGMPELDGYHLIRAVRALDAAQGGETPAVAVTAFARPEDRLWALRAGFQIHLAKPVNASELIVAVASLAGRLDGDQPAARTGDKAR